MLKINEAVIAEGRYDKIKLSNILDALIIETNGFGIYRDKEKLKFIKRLANERGIIILTDSDHSGFQIRNFLKAGIPESKIKHIYIPDILGKEKRKNKPSKEGKLGVEGMSEQLLLELFRKSNISAKEVENSNLVTSFDMFEFGFTGVMDAKENKRMLLKELDLPEFLSTKSLISYINSAMTREDFFEIANKIKTTSKLVVCKVPEREPTGSAPRRGIEI